MPIETTMSFYDQSGRRLQAVYAAASRLGRIREFDPLCCAIVETGRDVLGFDRIGLWLFEQDTMQLRGTYGTDLDGSTRDERDLKVTLAPEQHASMIASGETNTVFLDVGEIFDAVLSEPVGMGERMIVIIWQDGRPFAALLTDNIIRQQSFTPEDRDMFSVYSALVGLQAAHIRLHEKMIADRNLLRTVIDCIPDSIYARDLNGLCLLANITCVREAGLEDESELLGETVFKIDPINGASFLQEDRLVIETQQPLLDFETYLQRRDGQMHYTLTNKVPLRGQDGELIGIVGVSRDVTMYKQAENASRELMMERERLEMLRHIISSISHDLRTPMSVANTSLHILTRLTDASLQQERVEIIRQQMRILERCIEDLLTILRLETVLEMTQRPIPVDAVVQSATSLHQARAAQRGLTLTQELSAPDIIVLGDVTELNRAFNALVDNALRFTPSGGQVCLRTWQRGGQAILEVQDDGIGIALKDQQRVFEPFYRVDEARSGGDGGIGLGLTIARRITELHGGTMEVESELGQGARVRMCLPALAEARPVIIHESFLNQP
jgi:PAS domain S-box-containing protein